jgi:tripartite-type tricarboxylate transporter receptor subunit TctC
MLKATRILLVVLALAFAAPLAAQTWPSTPVTIVVGYPGGTASDVVARFLAEYLGARTGQPFLVENRPGMFANIAAQYVARAAPDGYTILLTTNATHAANIHLFKEIGFDPVKDFTPVTTIFTLGFVLIVNPAVVPVNSVAELTDYIKARPGKLAYGAGAATARVATELYLSLAGGLDVTFVPYKGSTQAINDLLGGRIHFLFADPVSGMQQARGGKARALAVTNANRISCAPQVPTMAEGGVGGYVLGSWNALFLPAKAPLNIAQKLAELSNALWATEKGREFLRNLCLDPYPGSPDSLAKLVQSDTEKWGWIIKGARIEPQ